MNEDALNSFRSELTKIAMFREIELASLFLGRKAGIGPKIAKRRKEIIDALVKPRSQILGVPVPETTFIPIQKQRRIAEALVNVLADPTGTAVGLTVAGKTGVPGAGTAYATLRNKAIDNLASKQEAKDLIRRELVRRRLRIPQGKK